MLGGLRVRQSPCWRMLWTCSSCLDGQNRVVLKILWLKKYHKTSIQLGDKEHNGRGWYPAISMGRRERHDLHSFPAVSPPICTWSKSNVSILPTSSTAGIEDVSHFYNITGSTCTPSHNPYASVRFRGCTPHGCCTSTTSLFAAGSIHFTFSPRWHSCLSSTYI